MTIHTITIHRALSLIKKATESLDTSISRGVFVAVVAGDNQRPIDRSYKDVAEIKVRIQSDTDKVESNLNLIAKLKTAISAKNLETKINFKGREVSITEMLAIKSLTSYRKDYLYRLREQTTSAGRLIDLKNSEILSEVAKDTTNSVNLLNQLQALNGLSIVTPDNESPAKRIQKLEEENEFLINEIDILLSENNLITTIEYEV